MSKPVRCSVLLGGNDEVHPHSLQGIHIKRSVQSTNHHKRADGEAGPNIRRYLEAFTSKM